MSTFINRRARIGIFDHTGCSLGGAQLVVGQIAAILSHYHEVDLINRETEYNLERLARAFCLDLSRVKERRFEGSVESFHIPGRNWIARQIRENARTLSQQYDLFIYSGHGVPPFCLARHGLVYCHFPMEASPDGALEADPRWLGRNVLDRWIRGRIYRGLWRVRMRGYDRILANSAFTAGWIEHRWGQRAEVVYPPVEVNLPQVEKRNLIVSIGRITGGPRTKNQLAQVRAFRQFLMQVPEGWQLLIVGTQINTAEDQAYLSEIRGAAEGLPVIFLLNADRAAICRALAEAKLFWHTAGLAIDENQYPELAEHFGIATVEAMRARCVPVVIASGGQREIIENGVSGFLARDLSELIQSSIALTREENLLLTMSQQAERRSMDFTGSIFDQRVLKIVSECLEMEEGCSRPLCS